MLKPHSYWDSLDYDDLEQSIQDDTDANVQKKTAQVQGEELERLKAEAKRKERAARVAALKAKKLGPKGRNLSAEEKNLQLQENELQAKAQLEQATAIRTLSEKVETLADQRRIGYELFQQGKHHDAVSHLLQALSDAREVQHSLPKESQASPPLPPTHLRSETCCNHHGHSHNSHHTHSHQSGTCDTDKEPKEENHLARVVSSAEKELLMLVGQCYIASKEWVKAVDTFRELLLLDRDVALAWVLRGTAFLEMGGPLLAQLHLTQPQVHQDAAHVKKLLARIKETVAERQEKSLEHLVEDEVIQMAPSLQQSTQDLKVMVQKRKAEGDRLRLEGFYYSAVIKYATCVSLLEHSQDRLHKLTVSCFLSLAACHIERRSNLTDAVQLCTRALFAGQESSKGSENPKALYYRAEARKQLGHYGLALEDLLRAKRACAQIYRLVQDPHTQLSVRDRIRGIPQVHFARALQDTLVDDTDVERKLAQLRALSTQVEKSLRETNRLWKKIGQLSFPRTRPLLARTVLQGVSWPATLAAYTLGPKHTSESPPSFSGLPTLAVVIIQQEDTSHDEVALPSDVEGFSVQLAACHGIICDDAVTSIKALLLGHPDAMDEKGLIYAFRDKAGYRIEVFGQLAMDSMGIDGEKIPSGNEATVQAVEGVLSLSGQDKPLMVVASLRRQEEDFDEQLSRLLVALHASQECLSFVVSQATSSGASTAPEASVFLTSRELFSCGQASCFKAGDKVEVLHDGEWLDGVVLKCTGSTVESILLVNGTELADIDSRSSIRPRSRFHSEPEILSTVLDILPTAFALATGEKVGDEYITIGRDLSSVLIGKESGTFLLEYGNFVPNILSMPLS